MTCFLLYVVLIVPYAQGSEGCIHTSDSAVPSCDTSTLCDTSEQESCDDSFLVQLREAMREDAHDIEQDTLDLLIHDMALEKNYEDHKGFFYTYLAPYCCSLLSLYSRIREYIKASLGFPVSEGE